MRLSIEVAMWVVVGFTIDLLIPEASTMTRASIFGMLIVMVIIVRITALVASINSRAEIVKSYRIKAEMLRGKAAVATEDDPVWDEFDMVIRAARLFMSTYREVEDV